MDTFWVTFGTKWATFYSNIRSHWTVREKTGNERPVTTIALKTGWTFIENVKRPNWKQSLYRFLMMRDNSKDKYSKAKEHSTWWKVSLYGWFPVLQVWTQLLLRIQITTYFLFWSNPILLYWRPDVQWSLVLWWVFSGKAYSSKPCIRGSYLDWYCMIQKLFKWCWILQALLRVHKRSLSNQQ